METNNKDKIYIISQTEKLIKTEVDLSEVE